MCENEKPGRQPVSNDFNGNVKGRHFDVRISFRENQCNNRK